jgi:teichuronic acid biosynthesis glycosyltransferase TuaG
MEEKLIEPIKNNSNIIYDIPLISVILPIFNKEKVLMKSIRSIQNQSFKNIEIIIVDDCSGDNIKILYDELLKTDQRIRIFYHLKNMGVWRTRIDGILYSRGKYIIHFDTGDLYSDKYALKDSFELAEKYGLDSIRMLFKKIDNYNDNNQRIAEFPINEEYNKIVYGKENIKEYNLKIFREWGTLWTRLTKAEIFIKGLYLLSTTILNVYKNFWEDIWWNKIVDEVSCNLLIAKRYIYLYLDDGNGVGTIKKNQTKFDKDKIIQEYIYFLYFDLEFLPKNDNKKLIINQLRLYNDNKNEYLNLKFLISKLYILDNLILRLLKDFYVCHKDKIFLRKLLSNKKWKNI